MDEFQRIAAYFAPQATKAGAFGLIDDAARLDPPPDNQSLVVTVDALVEGVHFLPSDPMESVARKLVRVNVSDLIAKGARPRDALLTLGWPTDRSEDELHAFAGTFGQELSDWGAGLIGGDTVEARGGLFFSLTMVGVSVGGGPVTRATANANDTIWVTGEIGWGAVGLDAAVSGDEHRRSDIDRYQTPILPILETSELIAEHASASMDVSDGLLADLAKLCRASGVGAKLHADRVPLAHPVSSFETAKAQLTGGDDYQVLFTAAPSAGEAIRNQAAGMGLVVTEIGRVSAADKITAVWQGSPVVLPETLGFTHK